MGELPVATLADEIETPGTGQVRALLTIAGNPALTTPDAGRLEGLLAGLELMISRRSVPERDDAPRRRDPAAALGAREVALRPRVHGALGPGRGSLLATGLRARDRLAVGVRDPRPPRRDRCRARRRRRHRRARRGHARGADRGGGRRSRLADPRPRSPTRSRDALGDRPVEERLLDLLLRTGHRGDAFGARPDGLSLAVLEDHPHGIDFGPLGRRLPDALATESGLVELAPPQLVADLARLDRALDAAAAGGMVLVGRRQLRTANSWTQNVPVLVRGKDTLRRPAPPGRRLQARPRQTAPVATVSSAAGSIDVPVELTDAVMPGVVCIPYGWGHGLPGTRQAVAAGRAGVNVNVLTDASVVDPLSGNAVLNGIPVTVAPA